MDLGSYRQGERMPLTLQCRAASLAPVLPLTAPRATVQGGPASVRYVFLLPPVDPAHAAGLFGLVMHLDRRFQPGRYGVRFEFDDAGSPRARAASFTVLPGGNPDGSVIAMYALHRPEAEFLLQQLDSGKLVKGRNPSV